MILISLIYDSVTDIFLGAVLLKTRSILNPMSRTDRITQTLRFGRLADRLMQPSPPRRYVAIGLACSLVFALLTGLWVIQEAYGDPLVVQDDARQHVFWMARFANPAIFPEDPIADYFQAVAPIGYTSLYRLAFALGFAPFDFNCVLPVLIALATTATVYGLTIELLPVPLTGFLATAILNLTVWMKDDVASGTPRAFVYLMLSLFLYGVVRRSWWWAAIAIGLTASFYPQYVIVEGTIAFIGAVVTAFPQLSQRFGMVERLIDRVVDRPNHPPMDYMDYSAPQPQPQPQPDTQRQAVIFWLSLWGVAIAALLIYALSSGDYGPTIRLEQARYEAEFWARGRSRFFDDDWVRFWLTGERSGFLPDRSPLFLWLGILLPVTLKYSRSLPLFAAIHPRAVLLRWWFVSLVSLFGLAHLLLFRLHLPSRYAHHNLKLLMAIASAIAVTLWVQGLWQWAGRVGERPSIARSTARSTTHRGGFNRSGLGRLSVGTLGMALILAIAASPLWLADTFHPAYQTGHAPNVYTFLQSTPIDQKIAGVDGEINNLPTFAQRSIIFGFEYAIPYQQGYYQPLKQRGVETISTFFSSDRQQVAEFVQRYDLGFWLVRRSGFQVEAIRNDKLLGKIAQSKFRADPLVMAIVTAIANLEAGRVPVLATDLDRCSVLSDGDFVILNAACTAQEPNTEPPLGTQNPQR